MTQESLKRFWNKTKNKSGAVLAGLLVGCALLCTPCASINAGASGEDVPAPPVGLSGNNYLQNGFIGGTFFMSQGNPSGYYEENGFCSLALQDNYTDPNKMAIIPDYNKTIYVPDNQGYDRAYGSWLLESFGDGANRPYAHVLEGQMVINEHTVNTTLYYGITISNKWVNVETFTAYLDGMIITIGETKNSKFTRYIETEIGIMLTCYDNDGKEVNYPFTTEKRQEGNLIVRKKRDIVATRQVNGRKYIYVKQLAFLGKITVDKEGYYRVQMYKGNVVNENPLTVYQYTTDMQQLFLAGIARNNDIGTIIFSPVKAFLNTELFPGFTFGTMLLIGLGAIVLGLYLKFALGG